MEYSVIKMDDLDISEAVAKAALRAESIAFLHTQTEIARIRLREEQAAIAKIEAAQERRQLATYGCAAVLVLTWTLHLLRVV